MGDDNKKKNVLLLIADDLGLHLGCYSSRVKTPHLDKLASQGTRFTRAFASTASCSGSRSTIYTGLHTHQNGQMGLAHGWNHFQTYDHVETLPQIFNALGYQTGIIGKVHVGPAQVYPWEVNEASQTRDVRWCAQRTEAFIQAAQKSNRPFHLTVGFRDPHRDGTRGGFGNDEEDVRDLDRLLPRYSPDEVDIPPFLSDVPEVREELAGYYRAIGRMDVGVGLIVDVLEKTGLDKSTMVVFVSDNGAPFINSKTTLYDAGVKLPLIVRCPVGTPGVVNPNVVSFIDILPTCLDWTGRNVEEVTTCNTGKSPRRLGRSFLPILNSSQEILDEASWQQWVFGSHTFHEIQNYWPTRFMRTRRFKYHRNIAWRLEFPFGTDLAVSQSWEGIRNATDPVTIGERSLESYLFRGPEELFDLENDPLELRNLAHDENHRDILCKCRGELEKWQYRTNDVWLFRDSISVVASRQHQEQGLRIPDRFDMDVEKPGNREGPHWTAPSDVEITGGDDLMFSG
ncbi:uncharacterized protein PV06_02620 [Exophiala oligosperma]|uniref:Sulfatase N-terminal domain-containing protein n=1 Tax=Exophiala oligosperma TaxID=215243 RepID=A0A0D2DWN4_9EURO|nr:uncharacterized protein PV06_02620 [Exophiala oligosperma]KIW47005.1 hypothetical protein PV06_02620 [Exophiala oligosperma]